MIIRLFSDLHLDGRVYRFTPQAHDPLAVLVLAGDMGGFRQDATFIAAAASQFKYVLFVAGNHEFYGGDYDIVKKFWHGVDDDIDNFFFMDNRVKVVDNVRFLGTTLWTDMDRGNPLAAMDVQRALNDYYVISYRHRTLRVADTVAFYNEAMRFLNKELVIPFKGETVVISHHTPSWSLVTDVHRTSGVNAGFHSNSDHLMFAYKIDYWLYGHTHVTLSRKINDTHVISNQRGYAGEDSGFDDAFWLDI